MAEQISAIEESRVITAEVLKKYLPDDGSQTTVPVYVGGQHAQSGDFERELLYKMLFDMRTEMSDIKGMLHELLSGRSTPEQAERIAGFLQAANIIPASQEQTQAPNYAESEEVTEPEKELTMRRRYSATPSSRLCANTTDAAKRPRKTSSYPNGHCTGKSKN